MHDNKPDFPLVSYKEIVEKNELQVFEQSINDKGKTVIRINFFGIKSSLFEADFLQIHLSRLGLTYSFLFEERDNLTYLN